MTRRRDLMCEDIFGCNHEPEIPVADDDGNITHYVCACGRTTEAPSLSEKLETAPVGHIGKNGTTPTR